jgi:hypothetical protein
MYDFKAQAAVLPNAAFSLTAFEIAIFFFFFFQFVSFETAKPNEHLINFCYCCFYIYLCSQGPEVELKDCISARKMQKAGQEKLRRCRVNEQFVELANVVGNNTTLFYCLMPS